MNVELIKLDFEKLSIQVYRSGSGPLLLLIHGVGPGTSLSANFGSIIPILSEYYTVIGLDLIGFGKSQLKTDDPLFDFDLWCRQVQFVAEYFTSDHLMIWGQSLGGSIALRLASDLPNYITKVITSGAAGANLALTPQLDRFWNMPKTLEDLQEMIISSVIDSSVISEDVIIQRFETLNQGGNGDYFKRMMSYNKQKMLDSVFLPKETLARIQSEVLVIHGREDVYIPYHKSALYLLNNISNCKALIIGNCGHSPLIEYSGLVMNVIFEHLK